MRASVVVLSAGVVCVLGVSFNATQTVPASVLAYLGSNIELGTHLRRVGITKPYIFHVVLAPECVLNPFTHRNETNFGPSRHGAGRDRPRARQTSGGGARELSGSGATAHIECSVPRAA